MVPDPKLAAYDPNQKKWYKVKKFANPKVPMIITEIRRPDPAAVLVLHSEQVVQLTNEEIRVLIHQDAGPLVERDLLSPCAAPGDKKSDQEGDEEGDEPEGGHDSDEVAGSSGKKAAKKASKAAK